MITYGMLTNMQKKTNKIISSCNINLLLDMKTYQNKFAFCVILKSGYIHCFNFNFCAHIRCNIHCNFRIGLRREKNDFLYFLIFGDGSRQFNFKLKSKSSVECDTVFSSSALDRSNDSELISQFFDDVSFVAHGSVVVSFLAWAISSGRDL